MGERWLITGATGFVGGALARALAGDGEEVHVVVRRSDDDPAVRALATMGTTHRHDGSTASMLDLVAAARPTVVVHLASNFRASHTAEQLEPLIRDNVLFGAQLLEAMQAAGVSRVVNVGSAWQHYQDAAYSPTSLYAATKQAFVDLLRYWVEASALRAVTLELSDTYGPGDERPRLLPAMCRAERTGETLAMVPPTTPVDLVHVHDVVAALRSAARRTSSLARSTHEIYAIRSGHPITMGELFSRWSAIRGTAVRAEWGARAVRSREMLTPWTQGEPLPGWSPALGLDEGLRTL